MRYLTIIALLPVLILAGADSPDSAKTWTPDPALAAGLSLAIPGGGQIYCKSYWKAPVAMALEGYLIYVSIDANAGMKSAEEMGLSAEEGSAEYLAAEEEWAEARERRNLHLWLLAGTILLSSIDAYVDAHLYDWNREMGTPIAPPESGIALGPIIDSKGGAGLGLTLRFGGVK